MTEFIAHGWGGGLIRGRGVELASPRAETLRDGRNTLRRADFREGNARLWEEGVIPDIRSPERSASACLR